ncbi:MAG TPA: CoA pyrophosphatase [Gemmatimonadaceae bacterium]|nr:CoA pyrophosphatase [Gemmatimonadaceae bacterium]
MSGEASAASLHALLDHADMARLADALRARSGVAIESAPPTRLAAIALVFRLGELGEPELLMIKRAEHEQDPWSGHVACPGGRMEPGDRDLEQTAIRETWEETGIDVGRVGRVLGTLDDISPRTPVLPPIVIRPFVAAVASDVEIVASPEVAAAFWVPLTALRERAAWGSGIVQVRGVDREVSTFTHQAYLVWGLTERVLRQLLDRMA